MGKEAAAAGFHNPPGLRPGVPRVARRTKSKARQEMVPLPDPR
jgi:hypothetical protein